MKGVCAERFEPPALMYLKKSELKITPIGLFEASSATGMPLNPSAGSER